MESSAIVAAIDLFIKTNQELAKTIFKHSITGYCLTILNSNVSIRKSQKSKILHWKSVNYYNYIAILDVELLWRLSTPSSINSNPRYGIIVATVNTIFSWQIKSEGIVYTWKNYGDKFSEIILRKHCSASITIAVNDYFGNDVTNVKGGRPMSVVKR